MIALQCRKPRRGQVVAGRWVRGRPLVPTLIPHTPRRKHRLDKKVLAHLRLTSEARGYRTCWECRDNRATDALVQTPDRKRRPRASPGGVCLEVVTALEARLDRVKRVYDEVYREGGNGTGLRGRGQLTSYHR